MSDPISRESSANLRQTSAISCESGANSPPTNALSAPSRRQVLLAAAATASLPLLSAALGSVRPANAADTPATTTAPAGKWTATTLKAADLKDNEFTATSVAGIMLARTGKTVVALSLKCTHEGCTMTPPSSAKIITCQCHKAQFNLDGTVAKSPAKQPLPHYAIRLNDKGIVEIDPTQKLPKDDKNATATLA